MYPEMTEWVMPFTDSDSLTVNNSVSDGWRVPARTVQGIDGINVIVTQMRQ